MALRYNLTAIRNGWPRIDSTRQHTGCPVSLSESAPAEYTGLGKNAQDEKKNESLTALTVFQNPDREGGAAFRILTVLVLRSLLTKP